jgi:hypothetical protein
MHSPAPATGSRGGLSTSRLFILNKIELCIGSWQAW